MHAIALDDARLLDTWDRAATLERPWRELAVLAGALGQSIDDLARLSIGARDRLLLGVRIGTFGSRLDCETTCPACGTRLELALDARDLVVPQRDVTPSELEVSDDEWTVRFRLPDSTDIAACMGATATADVLAERCLAVTSGEEPVAINALPAPRSRSRDRADGGARRSSRRRARPQMCGVQSRLAGAIRPRGISAARGRLVRRASHDRGAPVGARVWVVRRQHSGDGTSAPPPLPIARVAVSAPDERCLMSDFLARLGARHIAEPAVRPRAASRFEQASALPLEHESLDVDADPGRAHASRCVDRRRRSIRCSRCGAVLDRHRQARTSPTVEPTGTFAADPQSARAESIRGARAATSHRLRPTSMDIRVAPVVESPRPVDDRQRDAAAIVPRAPSHQRLAKSQRSRRASRSERRRRRARLERGNRLDGAAAAPDVVRVHIGRVEVRAVMPPAERSRSRGSKAAEAQGPLSLDRYLSGKSRP